MDTKSPIRDLYSEHNGITIMLEALHAMTIRVKSGGNVPKTDLVRVVEFLSVFADRCHHGKEEEILIPMMKQSGRADTELMSQIIGEHKTGRDLIGGMRSSLERYAKGQPEVYHFVANADAYIALLMDHIRKENVTLFPQAMGILDDKQQSLLSERFDRVETVVIGKGRHEQFHRLLGNLQKKYL